MKNKDSNQLVVKQKVVFLEGSYFHSLLDVCQLSNKLIKRVTTKSTYPIIISLLIKVNDYFL